MVLGLCCIKICFGNIYLLEEMLRFVFLTVFFPLFSWLHSLCLFRVFVARDMTWQLDDQSQGPRVTGWGTMELKVWVDGVQRIVCGVTEVTTCQEVVIALAQAIGKWILGVSELDSLYLCSLFLFLFVCFKYRSHVGFVHLVPWSSLRCTFTDCCPPRPAQVNLWRHFSLPLLDFTYLESRVYTVFSSPDVYPKQQFLELKMFSWAKTWISSSQTLH